jgi:putative DNA primase/helicase
LFIPFAKCFTGAERKYIKHDYLQRKDVLEYVLFRVLNTNYYQLSEPQACKIALDEYKAFNDPIRQFVDDVLPYCKWDLLPFNFLYDLYKSWFKKNSPNGTMQGRNTFIQDLLVAIGNQDEWYTPGQRATIRPGSKMACAEPLIKEYDLRDWMNTRYLATNDVNLICRPQLASTYRGLLRANVNPDENEDDEDTEQEAKKN